VTPRANFRPDEFAIAVAASLLAQFLFALALASPTPPAERADISDEATRPIAVPIVPVLPDGRVLKLGSPRPATGASGLGSPRSAKPTDVLPSTRASAAEPVVDAAVTVDAEALNDLPDASVGSGSVGNDASANSTELGDPTGGNDPCPALCRRAADTYRGQLAAFFLSRFDIRGRLPFDQMRKLRATATVTVSNDRRVTGFSFQASGDATFDAEARRVLSNVQSNGTLVPAPPPAYPELIAKPFPVLFQCTVQSACE
jgi:hypothetical protein